MKLFIKAALVRAIKTGAQTAVATIGMGAAFKEIDWLYLGSVVGVAMLLSILTSLATGLPEVKKPDGSLVILDGQIAQVEFNDVPNKESDQLVLNVVDANKEVDDISDESEEMN